MPTTSGKGDNKAMLQAAKAIAAAAASLASAAEALTLLYENEDEDSPTVKSGSSPIPDDRTSVAPTPSVVSTVNYSDSDDGDEDYMALAREEVRAATAAMSKVGDPGLQGKPVFSVTLSDIQAHFANKHTLGNPSDLPSFTQSRDGVEPSEASPPMQSQPMVYREYDIQSPVLSHFGVPQTPNPTFSTGPSTWADMAKALRGQLNTDGGTMSAAEASVRHNAETESSWEKDSNRVETPTRAPFQNLCVRWLRPTKLQKDILDSLRTERDMLVYHGNLKSHTHAILIRCMEVLKTQAPLPDPKGVISALIIVPQQTTGRLYLNFANELLHEFGLPHKAMLLPGGGTDFAVETERMVTERIDILIASPRIFINHVNGNPNLRIHLARLRFVVFAGAHELIRSEAFLSYQLNAIKKRMPTRAKSPRQIIIAGSFPNDQIQIFASRALAPNPSMITSTSSGDDLQEMGWQDLIQT